VTVSFRRIVVLLVAAVGATLASLTFAGPASAHNGNQSYLYLDITDKVLAGRIEAPVRDLNKALGLNIGGTDDEVSAAMSASLPAIAAYFGKHLRIGANGNDWPITFTRAERFFSGLPEQDANYGLFFFEADVTSDTVPRQLNVTFDPFFDELDRDGLLLISNDWKAGLIDNSHTVNSRFDKGSRSQVIDLGDTGWFKNFKASGKLGVNHIRTGPDHILFVLVLLLPSVLVFARGRWQPTQSFGASLWRVLKVVTMFTLAHSITFTLAGLDILPLPSSRIVESIIAISIAAAALHNLRPIFPNKEWAISFLFGLFHGLCIACRNTRRAAIDSADLAAWTQRGYRGRAVHRGVAVVPGSVPAAPNAVLPSVLYRRFHPFHGGQYRLDDRASVHRGPQHQQVGRPSHEDAASAASDRAVRPFRRRPEPRGAPAQPVAVGERADDPDRTSDHRHSHAGLIRPPQVS
jgi:HupE / UreJ protein